jgi:hypothetical protein
MRLLKVKEFGRFCRKHRIDDGQLIKAAREVASGLIDADLGGSVLKQRLARKGSGKSGGFRTILLFRAGEKCIFTYGFAKNDKANISRAELEALRALADEFLAYDEDKTQLMLEAGEWQEIQYEDEQPSL